MKILMTSDWYSPAVNGVVTSVKNLKKELEHRGHEVRVLTLSQNRHTYERDGVTYLGSVAAPADGPGGEMGPGAGGLGARRGPLPVRILHLLPGPAHRPGAGYSPGPYVSHSL